MSDVRCSPVDSTSKAPAPWPDAMTPTNTSSSIVLDALVRKSLLVADRSSGRTRFSMLETIRQFAEEQLVASGAATDVRAAHARYFAGREADIMALWDSPRQREAYEMVQGRTGQSAHGVSVGRRSWRPRRGGSNCDVRADPGQSGRKLRADRLGRRADRACPRRRPSPAWVPCTRWRRMCYFVGRIEAAVGYSDAGQTLLGSGRDYELPFGGEGVLGGPYLFIGAARTAGRVVPRPAGTRSRHSCPDPDTTGRRTDGRRCC